MNIQSLIYFASAAKHQSFTKAAEECLIAQTAMSRQIATIEQELEVKLFFRSNKRVKLTPAGESFYSEVQDILLRYRNAIFQTRDIDSGYNETLVIGFGLFDTQLVSEYIKLFANQNSNVAIILNQYPYDILVENLKESKCDIVFCPKNRTTQLKGVNMIEVKSYNRSVAVGNNNPLAQKSEITPKDLNQQVFINPAEDSAMHPEIFSMFCERIGITPKKIVRANSLDAILTMVEAGFGLALVPDYLNETVINEISVIPLKIENDRKREHVAVSLASQNNKAVKTFMNMVSAYTEARTRL